MFFIINIYSIFLNRINIFLLFQVSVIILESLFYQNLKKCIFDVKISLKSIFTITSTLETI